MIDRYTRPAMAAVWSEERKLSHWLRIEILAVQARVERGEVPAEDLAEIRARAAFDLERVAEIERTTNISTSAVERIDEFVEAGAQRLQIQLDHPFDMAPVEAALKRRG